ncbi:MAG TPA: IS110 family transposase [Candidatus Dormibacteraeota bacterium]|nr:IS110 family transposase [Candidatus Dormibacteraeota bacterium]
MDSVVERCAGLDVHQASITACVRFPKEGGGRGQEIQTFRTTTAGLITLRDWLASYKVTLVGMESTGVYWRAPFYMLEDAFEVWLLNAQHLHNVPGRKTDVADSAWICQLVEHGLVRPSFVPPKPIRELRDLTRYRKALIEERGREVQRLHKVLEDAGIKLASVASEVLGVSGRLMMEALVAGTRDPEVLAELAKGRLRAKLPALREALEGRFQGYHRVLIGELLAHVDYLDEAIERLNGEVDRVIYPFVKEVELLSTIPGIKKRTAEVLLAEIGPDMTRFATAAHLSSWAGLCPGNNESAGKHFSARTRKGSKWLRKGLVEAARAATRSKDNYLAAQYARLKGRRGDGKAVVAVAHSMLVIAYHVLLRQEPYRDLGANYFLDRNSDAHKSRLVRQLEHLGYQVTLTGAA